MICAHCHAPLPAGKRRYCSERCKRAAYIERYEARHGEHPRQRFVRLYREQTGESYDASASQEGAAMSTDKPIIHEGNASEEVAAAYMDALAHIDEQLELLREIDEELGFSLGMPVAQWERLEAIKELKGKP